MTLISAYIEQFIRGKSPVEMSGYRLSLCLQYIVPSVCFPYRPNSPEWRL